MVIKLHPANYTATTLYDHATDTNITLCYNITFLHVLYRALPELS